MHTLKRLGIYLATFFIVVTLIIGFIDWKWLDRKLVNKANKIARGKDFLNKEIVPVHLEHPDVGSEGESFRLFRQHTIKLLNTIANESKEKKGPKGVLLDIWFSKDTVELENLKAALKQLKDLKIPVYAPYNINVKHESIRLNKLNFDEVEEEHAYELYNDYLAGPGGKKTGSGRYHTFFYPDKDIINYETDIRLYSDMFDTVLIESIARRIAMDLGDSKTIQQSSKRIGSIVPIGSLSEMKRKTFTFIPDSNNTVGTFQPIEGNDETIDINKNILVVGDIANDLVQVEKEKIPGPYIVAWALSDLLDNNSRLKLPIENLSLIIGQILFFSLLTVFVFALIFKYIKRLQTKHTLLAIITFLISIGLLIIYGRLILAFNYVIPVGHTLVAMVVALILCWSFAHKFLVTGVAEGSQKYDVFISYSRNHGEWVYKNVYEPLADFRKPNGDKLNIFFDKKSIGFGEAFTAKYMWAIVDTKCFIPIISEDYYVKNHCRNELDCAMKRWVEKLLSIQAIAFSFKAVPEAYNSINFIDINVTPDFIEMIKAKLSEQ